MLLLMMAMDDEGHDPVGDGDGSDDYNIVMMNAGDKVARES